MDSINEQQPSFDVDAEIARVLQRRGAYLARLDRRRDDRYWQIALAGSLTGLGLVAGGIPARLAVTRVLH
jgi:hypothetical protein